MSGDRGVYEVRKATPDDYADISRLFESSYPLLMRAAYEAAVLEPALPMMTRANPMLLASGTFFVAEGPSGVLGCGGWTRERPGHGEITPGLGHIRHFATHPGHIGRGVGRALYDACAEQARSAGIDRFECYASLNAEGFYAALGFEAAERIELAITDTAGLPAVRMTCSLRRPPA